MTSPLERGSAPVEFVLVGLLLTVTALSTLQVAVIAHIRAIAIDSVIAGAAHAALADTSDDEGVTRTRELISLGIAADLVRAVSARSTTIEGRDAVEMSAELAIPGVGLWVPVTTVDVYGHAYREGP